MTARAAEHGVSLREATRVWARIAALSFGGPAGQIAVMHRILVDERRWISEERFLHALSYCMLLPGPEAQQLATYIGWLMHKTKGGLIAGGLFVLPGFVTIMVLSWLYALLGSVPAVAALFMGLKAAVLAIVLDAVRRIGSRALKNNLMRTIAAAAFVAIFFLNVPFPAIVLAAATIGYFGGRAGWAAFAGSIDHGPLRVGAAHPAHTVLGDEAPEHATPSLRWSFSISAVFLFLWLAPVVTLVAALGPHNVFSQIALFFSQMAVVTFGGAYAVLAYVAQEAVGTYGWLRPGEMLDGLGMAETTPGPLIMVTQFVGFMGAMRQATGLNPMVAATLGGILTTWVTFVPCFLWIFLGAPFVERLRNNRALSAALATVTAAIVGVVLNLAVWFALHTLFADTRRVGGGGASVDLPVWPSVNGAALGLSLAALIAIFHFRVGTPWVLLVCAVAGVAYHMVCGGI